MHEAIPQQAVGLATLHQPAIEIAPLLSAHAGVGRRALLRQLGLAELRRGGTPLLIDEEEGALAQRLGVYPRGDLQDCLDGRVGLRSLVGMTSEGLPVVAGEQGLATLALRPAALSQWLTSLALQPDAPSLILINARAGQTGVVHALAELGVSATLVTSTEADALTATYQLTKRLSAQALLALGVLYNRATAEQARRAHDGLADAAQRFLGVRLAYLGSVPYDPVLAGLPPGVRRRPVPLSAAGSSRPACDRLLWPLRQTGRASPASPNSFPAAQCVPSLLS